MLYVPILKCKQGEKDALYTLKEPIKDEILPLFEVTPDIIEKGSFAGVDSFWSERLFIFDISPEYYNEIDDEDYLSLFRKCNSGYSIPTIKLFDSEEKIKELVSISTNGIALRLSLKEILDDEFEEVYEEVLRLIDESNTDLIIDVRDVDPDKVNETTFLVKGALDLITNIRKFRRVIFASNSFPKSLEVERHKLISLPRIESNLYKKIEKHLKKEDIKLVYGDYCVNHWTYFEFILGIQPSFNIRYTTENSYIIFKGNTNKKGGLKIENVKEACKLLASSTYYMGMDYSWGDNEIFEKANAISLKSGNLTTWRAIGTNHHITFIVNHFSSLS